MRIVLPYGTGSVDAVLRDDLRVTWIDPDASDGCPVADPVPDPVTGRGALADALRGARRTTIVVPGGPLTAATRSAVGATIDDLHRADASEIAISILVGRAAERSTSGADPADDVAVLRALERRDASRPVRVVASDPDEAASFVEVADARGAVRRLHRLLVETDLVVVVDLVEPDDLLGWTGGATAIAPGCMDRETGDAALRPALDAVVAPDGSVRARRGASRADPARAAIERAATLGAPTFARLHGVGSRADDAPHDGVIARATEAAVAAHVRRFGTPRPAAADLVVAGGDGLGGRDLLGAVGALSTACAVAKVGAPVVWLAHAEGGAGPSSFLRWFEAGRPERHLAALRRAFEPVGLVAYALRRAAERNPVHVVSALSRDVLRPLGLLPHADAQSAIDAASAALAPGSTAVVLPHARRTVLTGATPTA